MILGGWRISGFAAFMAVLGILAVLGGWDAERTIRRNLEGGREVNAMITGAHQQRRFPLTFDGLRPRLLDETYSLDLAWRGPDRTEYARQKVPVSREYIATVMVGDQVKLIAIPVKVVDGPHAVPTIVPDAAVRLGNLAGFEKYFGIGAVIAAAIAAIGFASRWWRRRRAVGPIDSGPEPAAMQVPSRLVLLTVVCLGAAGLFGYFSLRENWDAAKLRTHGTNAPATIIGFHTILGNDRKVSYTIELAWRDEAGAERRFGPTHISNLYALRIAVNGALVIRQAAIRYIEDDRSVRPIILADADEYARQTAAGMSSTMIFGIMGIFFGGLTVWRMRRRRRQGDRASKPEAGL